MPKRRTKKKFPGVTRKTVKTPVEVRAVVESGPTIEGMQTVWKEACEAFAMADDLAGQLDSIEAGAREIVESSGDTEAVRYAQMAWAHLRDLRRALKTGSKESIALAAMRAGSCSNRLQVYLHGPHIVQVREITRKLKAGAKAYDDKIRQGAVERWKDLQNIQPDRKLSSIDRQVADEFGIGIRTVQRWRGR